MAKKRFSNKCFIGVDVSKSKVDIYLPSLGTCAQVPNEGQALKKWLKTHAPDNAVIVFEATGGYERTLIKALGHFPSLQPLRIHPSRIKSFARAFGIQAKTDILDAKILSLAAEQLDNSLHDSSVEENVQYLRDLMARSTQLQDMIHAENCRLKRLGHSKTIQKSLQKTIIFLKKQLMDIETEITELIAEDPCMRVRSQRLQEVVGVGQKTAQAILAFLPELGTVDRKKISALAGFAPFVHQSGNKSRRAYTSGGRKPLKKALYMAALVGIRYNKTLCSFYNSLLEKGKPKMVALIACARKLLIHLNAIERKAVKV